MITTYTHRKQKANLEMELCGDSGERACRKFLMFQSWKKALTQTLVRRCCCKDSSDSTRSFARMTIRAERVCFRVLNLVDSQARPRATALLLLVGKVINNASSFCVTRRPFLSRSYLFMCFGVGSGVMCCSYCLCADCKTF